VVGVDGLKTVQVELVAMAVAEQMRLAQPTLEGVVVAEQQLPLTLLVLQAAPVLYFSNTQYHSLQ
jgi:hypothetical protein